MEKKRLIGLDIVRTAAILFVITLHATSLSGVFDGEKNIFWGVCLYLRQLCMSCVPLFLILSGYLQKNKKLSASYYFGVIPLYLSYAVISALCMLAYAVQGYMNGNMDLTLVTAVYKILDFSANGYAWYFEMFLGLFLLIPFLNALYGAVETKRGKLVLILTLAFLTLIPDTVSGFAPYYAGTSSVTLNIFPDFFKTIYPVTYYILGSFIAEFKPKLKGAKKLVALCAPIIPAGIIAAYSYARGGYAWYMFNGFQTLTVALTAVCVFLALYDVDFDIVPIKKVFSFISKNTFEMYLFSYLWDNLFYSVLGLGAKLPLALMVVLVFTCSLASAALVGVAIKPVSKGIIGVLNKKIS